MNEVRTSTRPRGLRWFGRYVDRSDPNGLLRTLRYAAAALGFMLFFVLLALVHRASGGILLDHAVQARVFAHRTPGLTWFFLHISELASVPAILLLLGGMSALLYRTHRALAGVLVLVLVLDGGVTEVAKELVRRARPLASTALVHETSFSFPSGHTMAAVLCWGVLAYVIARSCRTGWQNWITLGLYALGILLVSASRIYLGAHYPSDVLGSILLGGSLLGVLLTWLLGRPGRLPAELFGPSVLKIFGIVAAVVVILSLVVPRFFG